MERTEDAVAMKKTIALFLLLSAVIAADCEAVNALEKLILRSPRLAGLIALAACLAILSVVVISNTMAAKVSGSVEDRKLAGKKARIQQKIQQEKHHQRREKIERLRANHGVSNSSGSLTVAGGKHVKLINMHTGGRYNIYPAGETTIGRAAVNTIVLKDLSISRHHAKIVPAEKDYFVYDLNSTRGTFVNGGKIKSKALEEGDIIGIKDVPLLFSLAAD